MKGLDSMRKFKVGDIVTGRNSWQLMSNGRTARIETVLPDGYRVSAYGINPVTGGTTSKWYDYELKLVKGANMKFSDNDIIVDDEGDFYKVLASTPYGAAVTVYHNLRSDAENDKTFCEFKDNEELEDYTLASSIKEVTLDEIATKFGVDVKNIRVKEWYD